MEYTIYSITCNQNSSVYFGRSQEVEKRWRAHKNMLRKSNHSNTHLQLDWDIYGESEFTFKILHVVSDLDLAISLEQKYIDDPSYNKYNISDANMGGDTFTNNPRKDEISKMKSINSSGERNPMYGKPKNEYTLKRIKEANSVPIVIDSVTYSSLTEASNVLGVGVTTINYRLKSNSDRFKEWKYIS
jgi:group I intron endonuclease